MSRTDLDINRRIRQVLVRHWIDLGSLSVRSSFGRVSIRGTLRRLEGYREELTPTLVDQMFLEIRRIPEIERLIIELDNWVNVSGQWKPLDKRERACQASREPPAPGVIFDAERPPPT